MRRQFDPQKYHEHFQEKVDGIRAGPVEDQYRSCNDICCLVTLLVLIVAMVVFGIIMMSEGNINFQFTTNINGASAIGAAFTKFVGIILAMLALCVIISIIFIFLIKTFPKCMVYSMIIGTVVVLIALIVIAFINDIIWLAVVCIIFLVVIGCILLCCRDKIRIGIQLLKAAGQFITEKPQIYTAPLYSLFFGFLFYIFWIFAFLSTLYVANQKQNNNQSTGKETFFLVYFIFMMVFMQYLLYYVVTFIIATACAFWYYDIQAGYCGTAVKRVNRFHLGSVTFGAIIVAVINLLRRLVQQESRQQFGEGNAILGCCLCLLGCCLSCIEGLLNVLNHNAVIVMSVTGQSYINSAKSAISIVFDNFSLFYVTDFISDVVHFFGVLLAAGIPTLIGFLIVQYAYNDQTQEQVIGTTLAIFLLSLFLASILIGMVGEALSCIFIFYCFDRKFLSMGINVTNSPQTIRNLMDYSEGGDAYQGQAGTGVQLRDRRY